LLLARPGIDPERIILLGAVAGGGDPAAVTAALDPRIAAVVPFNFGGPQPETAAPLPPGAEQTFNYAGGGSWESTRNLRLSARDGFLPWVIVGAVAPRRLIYAHEFSWDQERDPVWARLTRIYGLYRAGDHLASVHGRGRVTGQPPESTHCNNIGPEHRRQIYPALKRWFGIPEPDLEYRRRRTAEELTCLPRPGSRPPSPPRALYELAGELGAERLAAARQRLARGAPAAQRQQLAQNWARLLGDVTPTAGKAAHFPSRRIGKVTVDAVLLPVEADVVVPVLLLVPEHRPSMRLPVVVGFAQQGKQEFLRQRSEAVAALLDHQVAVCLPDLRGTGETRPAEDTHGRQSSSTALSATEWMLGQTLLGARLRDLRSVLRWLRGHPELDPTRLALWGDSFAPANPAGQAPAVPLDAAKLPRQSEPMGGLLALLAALFEDDIRAVAVQGGLTGYQSILESPFCYVPHDVLVPGALTAGDVCDVAAALAPRPLRLAGLVGGRNVQASSAVLPRTFAPARAAYATARAPDRLQLEAGRDTDEALAGWLRKQLQEQ
jgi:hypothetical protein